MKRLTAMSCLIMIMLSTGTGLVFAAADPSGSSPYPEIRLLSADDALFVQQQSELEDFYRLSRSREKSAYPPVSIFAYRRRAAEDLFSLNARLGIPYDTLATLNGAANAGQFKELRQILISSQSGLFVNDPPQTALERMMLSSRLSEGKPSIPLLIARDGKGRAMRFFPGDSFSAIERAYFLGILYQFPIVQGKITSLFGMRRDPFTGVQQFHSGIDIGAAEGTTVHAARDGVVAEVGSNEVLGDFVVLSHPGGFQTVYGHLAAVGVKMGYKVAAGNVIGAVGRSGRATGPHLHFEVKKKGSTRDPFPLLAMRKG